MLSTFSDAVIEYVSLVIYKAETLILIQGSNSWEVQEEGPFSEGLMLLQQLMAEKNGGKQTHTMELKYGKMPP